MKRCWLIVIAAFVWSPVTESSEPTETGVAAPESTTKRIVLPTLDKTRDASPSRDDTPERLPAGDSPEGTATGEGRSEGSAKAPNAGVKQSDLPSESQQDNRSARESRLPASPALFGQELEVPDDAATLIEALYAEFDPTVPAGVRAEADRATAARAAGVTPAKAWNDYAVGMHLVGASRIAVWAGLNAVRRAWRAEFVANLGTILVAHGRAREGLSLLESARAMGRDTPWLHEAMAAAYASLGDAGKAKTAIGEAARRAPYDTAIRIEESLATTGEPPEPAEPRQAPVLEQAYGELEAHVRFVSTTLQDLARALDDWEAAAGFKRDEKRAEWVQWRVDRGENWLRAAHAAIERATSREPFYAERPLNYHNEALLRFVVAYTDTTIYYLRSLKQMRADWVFWSNVAWRGEEQYIRRIFRDYPSPLLDLSKHSIARPMGTTGWDLQLLLLLKPHFEHYWSEFKFKRCKVQMKGLDRLEATVERRLRVAAPRFDAAVRGVLAWNQLVVLDARRYARKWMAKLYEHDQHVYPVGANRSMEELHLQKIDQAWDYMTFEPAGFLDRQVHKFKSGRRHMRWILDGERRWDQCPPPQKRSLADMSEEELRELMAKLAELMKQDVTAEYVPVAECEISAGNIKLKLDETGKAKLDVDGVAEVSPSGDYMVALRGGKVGRAGATGIAAEYGQSIKGGEGLVGSASIKVAGKWDPATGDWEAVAELGGKVGAGVAVPKIGGAACYPGSGKVTLNARSFLEKEIVYQRISEELARR